MRKTLIILLLLLPFILLSACQSTGSADSSMQSESISSSGESSPNGPNVQQSDMWQVELIEAELSDSLTTTIAAIQYSVDILETTSEIKPESGNAFLLLYLSIEKIGTGKSSFSWSDAHILDSDGNMYYRHPNDTFLANLNIPRLKGTDITFGAESGYACFEIPQGAEGLKFVADEGRIIIEVQL